VFDVVFRLYESIIMAQTKKTKPKGLSPEGLLPKETLTIRVINIYIPSGFAPKYVVLLSNCGLKEVYHITRNYAFITGQHWEVELI